MVEAWKSATEKVDEYVGDNYNLDLLTQTDKILEEILSSPEKSRSAILLDGLCSQFLHQLLDNEQLSANERMGLIKTILKITNEFYRCDFALDIDPYDKANPTMKSSNFKEYESISGSSMSKTEF